MVRCTTWRALSARPYLWGLSVAPARVARRGTGAAARRLLAKAVPARLARGDLSTGASAPAGQTKAAIAEHGQRLNVERRPLSMPSCRVLGPG